MILAGSSHPVQYRAPLYRYFSLCAGMPVHAVYLRDHHLRETYDPDFGVAFRWEMDLLGGYTSSFVTSGSGADRVGWWRAFNGTQRLVRKVAEGLPSLRAILIHSYTTPEGFGGLFAARKLRIPALLMEEVELTRHRSVLKRISRSAVIPPLLRLYDSFLYIGSRNRRFYERYGVEPERLFFTPYSVDNEAFSRALPTNLAKRDATRCELHADPSDCVVLFAGKLIPRKRPLDLVDAAALLAPERRPFLLFVGSGELATALRARAAELRIQKFNAVGFKNVDEIGQYYAASDIFVLPSEYETWGLVVNEAMIHSLPVIASDSCGCSPDLVRDGETGFRFPAGDIQSLAKLLGVLGEKEALRRDLGNHGRSLIDAWSYAQVAQGLQTALAFIKVSKNQKNH